MKTDFCHVCRDATTSSQIKACCGHLVFICDDCRDEQAYIMHQKCIVCRGFVPSVESGPVVASNVSWYDDVDDEDQAECVERKGG